MKKLRGFSLAEMMVVLLIISIVAAAAAPMVNKRALSIAAERTPWVWTNQNNIAYNLNGNQNQTATVGAMSMSNGNNARLYVDSTGTTPHIAFGNGRNNITRLFANANQVILTNTDNINPANLNNTVAIGRNVTPANRAISIGIGTNANANAGNNDSIALGFNSQAIGQCSIAIGTTNADNINPTASGFASIAIGRGAVSGDTRTIAIGDGANATNVRAISIGRSNVAGADSIVIGDFVAQQTNSGVVAIGNNTFNNVVMGQDSVAIGDSVIASEQDSVAIGRSSIAGLNGVSIGVRANRNDRTSRTNAVSVGMASEAEINAVAIGSNASATGANSIAIGGSNNNNSTRASGVNSIAIGNNVRVTGANSIAIGNNISLTDADIIQLGSPGQTVYIPGKLIVDSDVTLKGSKIRLENLPEKGNPSSKLNGELRSYLHTSAYFEAVGIDTSLSDRRLKNVGESFKAGLEEINKLEVFHYMFKKDSTKTPRVGVMAQDLQKIFPDAVFKGEDGFLRIRMEDMFYAVVNAIKELDLKLIANDKKIEDLEKQNSELESLIDELEAQVKQLNK